MIRYDTEQERSLIMQMLDVALMSGGLKSKAAVDFVLGALEKSPEPEVANEAIGVPRPPTVEEPK